MQRKQLLRAAAFAATARRLMADDATKGKEGPSASNNNVNDSNNNKSDGEGFNLNFETKADEAFFRAQEQAARQVPGNDYNQRLPGAGEKGYSASLPTAAKYRAMSEDELIQLLKLRDKQIADIRLIYENFHNEVEKQYRTQIFDYHDKAIGFSQTHGQMQSHSINHTREALTRMREQEELEHRDLKICYTACLISTFIFWLWVRSHYINKEELTGTPTGSGEAPFTTRTQGLPFFEGFSRKLSANSRETWWEKDQRIEREELAKQQKASLDGSGVVTVTDGGNYSAGSNSNSSGRNAEDDARDAMRKERAWR